LASSRLGILTIPPSGRSPHLEVGPTILSRSLRRSHPDLFGFATTILVSRRKEFTRYWFAPEGSRRSPDWIFSRKLDEALTPSESGADWPRPYSKVFGSRANIDRRI
jgi:hypothetical protein